MLLDAVIGIGFEEREVVFIAYLHILVDNCRYDPGKVPADLAHRAWRPTSMN